MPSTASSSSRSKPHEAPYVGPRWWVAALWLFGAIIVQLSLARMINVRGTIPSTIAVVVAWYALRADARRSASFGLIAGLCEDVIAGTTGGAWTVSTTLAALFANRISSGFFADSIPLAAFVAFATTIARNTMFWVMMRFEGYPPGLGRMHLREAIVQAILNAAVMIALVAFTRRDRAHLA